MSTCTRSDHFRRRYLATLVVALLPAVHSAPALAADPAPPPTAPDPLEPLRERFRAGMEKYKANQFAEAIVEWESIYAELGPDNGYRLSFNLARAYDARGNPTDIIRAAEHYAAYLDQVGRRRERGDALEANVEKQAEEARTRLDTLTTTIGRIAVPAADRPVEVRIPGKSLRLAGFVAYVAPGTYTVTFGAGKDATDRTVSVKPGELVEVAPPLAPAPPPRTSEPTYETHVERPFPSLYLWIAGGVTLASTALPIVMYGNALSIKSDYDAEPNPSAQAGLAPRYEDAKRDAYFSLIPTLAFAAGTAALATWYFVGTKESRVRIEPSVNVGPQGAAAGLVGHF